MIPSSVMITARLAYTTTMVAVRITASEVAADCAAGDFGAGVRPTSTVARGLAGRGLPRIGVGTGSGQLHPVTFRLQQKLPEGKVMTPRTFRRRAIAGAALGLIAAMLVACGS